MYTCYMATIKKSAVFLMRLMVGAGILFLVVYYIKNLLLALGCFFILAALDLMAVVEWGVVASVLGSRGANNNGGFRDASGKVEWGKAIGAILITPVVSVYFWGVPFALGALLVFLYR